MELGIRFFLSGHTFLLCAADSGATEKIKLPTLPEWWAKWIRRSRRKHPLSVIEMSREGLKDL
jgi:hypothetical protein